MTAVLGTALLVPLGAFLIGLMAAAIRKGRPKALDGESGVISPERISAAMTVLFGAGLAAGGAVLTWDGLRRGAPVGVEVLSGLCCALGGSACAGFMAPSLTNLHNVCWTAAGVCWTAAGLEGPSRTFGPTLGLTRATLRWSELTRTGKTSTGYWYVEAKSGGRVYWSYLYKGCAHLAQSLRQHCPELALPSDMR